SKLRTLSFSRRVTPLLAETSNPMRQLLVFLLSISVPLFAVSSMLSIGMRFPVRDILEPLRHRRGVLLTLAANFVFVPLLAWVIDEVIGLDHPYRAGLILIAS